MIITSIHSGMGNQMFMYAAGLSAASRLNTELRLGLWSFRTRPNKERSYALDCFPGITEREASFRDLWEIYPGLALMNTLVYKPMKKYSVFRRLLRKILVKAKIFDGHGDHYRIIHRDEFLEPKYSRIYIQVPGKRSYSQIAEIPDGVCLMGYWSSEKFFSGISDLVRKKFTFHPDFFRHGSYPGIKSSNSVALHVRRGDKTGSDFFCCSEPQWLKAALEKISSLTENPSFFVFSDDIQWCRENLPKIYDAEYTYLEGNSPAQDMALMTKCRHVITAPSTFSWWAAWLNDSPGKIIIIPEKWTTNGRLTRNFVPDGWIIMD